VEEHKHTDEDNHAHAWHEHRKPEHHEKKVEPHHHEKSHVHHHKKESGMGFTYLMYGFFAVIGILLIFNFMQLSAVGDLLQERIGEAKEASVPAIISLTTIVDGSCSDCFDVAPLIEKIEGAHVNITERIEMNADEGAALLEQYGIEQLPTIIITGEINKSGITGLDVVEDALVLTAIEPPYTDVASGNVFGRVTAIHINDPACTSCVDLSASITELRESLTITRVDTFARTSVNAKAAIANYGITKLPALILSSEYGVYAVAADLEAVGEVASDGSLVIETLQPPYVNAVSGEVEGVVDWIMLTDASCSTCYDATMHRAILARFGFAFGKEESFDISSTRGKELVAQYAIDSVPAIIVSKDAKSYAAFTEVWPQVGTEETDGKFIFRNNEILGQTYKDLTTNTIIEGGTQQ
jgi:thiol-disulfide isomerase/thioredoxin